MLEALSSMGINIPILPEVIGFTLLTITPGVLLLGIAGFDFDSFSSLVYVVAVSLVSVGTWFTVLNGIYLSSPYWLPAPLLNEGFIIGATSLTGILAAGFMISGSDPNIPHWKAMWRHVDIPIALLLVILPFLGAYSGILINRYQSGLLAILTILLISVFVPIIFNSRIQQCWYPLVAWSISLTLLLQNSVRTIYLNRGDGKYEYYLARVSMEQGYWDPGIVLNKNSMLRIMIIHPVYTRVTDIPLFWEFKLIHPLLLSIIGIGIYIIFQRQFGARIAMFSVLCYMFLHPFYNRLARDTRTGIALLFLVACVLLWTDTEISNRKMAFITPFFLFGMISSHYGTTILSLFMISGAIFFIHIESILSGEKLEKNYAMIPFIAVIMMYIWYNHTSGGQPFQSLTTISFNTLISLNQFFGIQSRSTQVISSSYSSYTMKFIKYEFIAITLISATGYLFATFSRPLLGLNDYCGRLKTVLQNICHNRFVERIRKPWNGAYDEVDSMFYYLAGMGFVILLLSFAPVDILGISRVYMIGGLFIIPFGISFITFANTPSIASGDGYRKLTALLTVLIAGMLLINSGVVSAIAFDEKNPQPNLNRQGIIENGDEQALFTLYARYTSKSDYTATVWLQNNKRSKYVFTSGGLQRHYPSYLTETTYDGRKPPGVIWNSIADSPEAINNYNGYIMIDEFVTRTGKVGVETRPKRTINTKPLSETNADIYRRSQVYNNGNTKIYLTD